MMIPMLNIVNTNTDGAVAEGGKANFAVTLAAKPTGDVTVNWTTADGTAVQPADYTTKSGSLTFTGNEKIKTFFVDTIDDDNDEPDQENFVVRLSGETPSDVVYLNQEASVSLNDNDTEPTLSFGTIPTITEGEASTSTIQIPVSLNNPSNQEITVDFAVTAGTAALTHDYTVVTSPQQINLPPTKSTTND